MWGCGDKERRYANIPKDTPYHRSDRMIYYIDPEFEKLTTTGLDDFHGGHGREHRTEMRMIARAEIQDMVPRIATEIYNQAITRLIGAIQYDIDTCVNVALKDAGTIFNEKKFNKIISDEIMKRLKAELGDLKIKI